MQVTKKDVVTKAIALSDALKIYVNAENALKAELKAADKARATNNFGESDNITNRAKAAFQHAINGLDDKVSKSSSDFETCINTWNNQADVNDQLIISATQIIAATGKSTPHSILDALIDSAQSPCQLDYLRALFVSNKLTIFVMKVDEKMLQVKPSFTSSGCAAGIYMVCKHGTVMDGVTKQINKAINELSEIIENFSNGGNNENE